MLGTLHRTSAYKLLRTWLPMNLGWVIRPFHAAVRSLMMCSLPTRLRIVPISSCSVSKPRIKLLAFKRPDRAFQAHASARSFKQLYSFVRSSVPPPGVLINCSGNSIFDPIRKLHKDTPILILGGHTHIRDCGKRLRISFY